MITEPEGLGKNTFSKLLKRCWQCNSDSSFHYILKRINFESKENMYVIHDCVSFIKEDTKKVGLTARTVHHLMLNTNFCKQDTAKYDEL